MKMPKLHKVELQSSNNMALNLDKYALYQTAYAFHC